MTTPDDRRGVLDAVERIVNRGGEARDVVGQVLGAVRRLYPDASLESGRVVAGALDEEDGALLERVSTLVSAYTP